VIDRIGAAAKIPNVFNVFQLNYAYWNKPRVVPDRNW